MSTMAISVSRKMERILNGMARRRRVSRGEVLRRAVLLMKFLSDWDRDPNHEIIIRDPKTGRERRLVMVNRGI
jgi:hypothetical protein